MHKGKSGKLMYCTIAMKLNRRTGQYEQKNYYAHAHNAREAKLGFCKAFPNRETHIYLETGLALGFFVAGKDRSGEVVKDVFSAD